ncbi:MAG: hypothetical protein QMB37_09710 [Paludibacteraceae bacterium]|nr:hypothetical protein [Paludibacteraceae bacterium]
MKHLKLQRIFFVLSALFIFNVACTKENNGITDTDEYYENEESKVEVLLTFENFKKHVKTLKISGFSLVAITAGEDGSKEYEAKFKNKDGRYLFVKIAELATKEPVWYNPQNTYLLDERKAEYANTQLIHGLTIHLPQIEAAMSVHATVDLGKANFETIARQSGFLTIDPETVQWPTTVPENHKFKGWLLEVEVADYAETPGFTKQMFATMMVTDELVQSYKETFNAYFDNNSDHIVFPNGTYMIVPGENYDNNNLYDFYSKYDRIQFMYYMP